MGPSSTTGSADMRRTTLAVLLATLAATAFAAQVPTASVTVEGRSTDASNSGQGITAKGVQAINHAAAAAVIGALETRFTGQGVQFRLGEVRSERVSLRDIALHGSGEIRFGKATDWLPITFDVLYDSTTQVVESPAIVLGASTPPSSAQALPLEGLQADVARRLNAEFASQSVAFELEHSSIVGGDGRRVVVNANGMAHFDNEDAAPVQVQAVYDRVSNRWIDASYEFAMVEDAQMVATRSGH